MTYPLRTIQEDGDAVVILDQTRLPREVAFVRLRGLDDAAHAIRVMQVRGAPLIGATAAYGVALALQEGVELEHALATLAATRPTAVNLHWALSRMRRVLQQSGDAEARSRGPACGDATAEEDAATAISKSASRIPLAGVSPPLRGAPSTASGRLAQRREHAWSEARAIAREDEAANAAIGQHGLPLLKGIARRKGQVNVMTHCNAGWLATVAHGTALAPIYAAQAAGIDVHVWVSETRPRNQGLLTAWELIQAGVPHTLIADNAAGLLLMQGKVDMVIVGADRIAANGDTANKVGTYLKALASREHGVPFYVAAPVSTIDFACPDGAHIPIEDRAAAELGAGDSAVANPAFDVTPAALIAGIVTERGLRPAAALAGLLPA